MLERKYAPSEPYRVVYYGRMSSTAQNQRSPDQQFDTITETMKRCGYPWHVLKQYRDNGISGRYLTKRTGLQNLLRDIEVRLVQPDLIAVDTLERLGRAEEIAEMRRKLLTDYGVLVVAADNNFADPTGVVGKAVCLVESIRSTEDTRIKRHNVLRGKKDAARQKRWPGGAPPFGYRLQKVVDNSVNPPTFRGFLVPEPRQAEAIRLAFHRADQTGEGNQRLSRWWNTCPDIPDDLKPISPFTMGYWLRNRIYVGELVWGANRTGVANDRRVTEKNPDGPEVIPDFCEPLVCPELFARVLQVRKVRSDRIRTIRQASRKPAGEKRIAPQVRGLTLKYLLTGLVRCGCCQASMRPVSSGRKSKAGRTYTYYTCPRHYEGACSNSHHVNEEPLREAVLSRIRSRLFPPSGSPDETPSWLPELLVLVQDEWRLLQEEEPDVARIWAEERTTLQQQMQGWALSLGDPALPPLVRGDLQALYAQASQRIQELQQSLDAHTARQQHLDKTLDPARVIDNLRRLDQVLTEYNPTLGNLELSKHIDQITCHADGRVELRGTLLGLLEGGVDLLSREENPRRDVPAMEAVFQVKPRRRGALQIPSLSARSQEEHGHLPTSLDPERFAGLPGHLFWEESFVLPRKLAWYKEHATEVANLRSTGLTHARLADHFGKTVPIIRMALRWAERTDPRFRSQPGKMPPPNWAKEHAAEIARLRGEGLSVVQIARRMGKSEPTVRAALKHAAAQKDSGN